MAIRGFDLTGGTPVILYLQAPKEKIWGILVSLTPAGIVLRGLDLAVFDDWMRQEARGDHVLVHLVVRGPKRLQEQARLSLLRASGAYRLSVEE